MEIERRVWDTCRLEVRLEEGKPARIVGRAVPFGELSLDLGGWREIIDEGAFDIAGDIRSLWQHDMSMVLGRTTAGTMTLTTDARGIYTDITPPETQWARDAVVTMRRGDVDGFSFGFYVLEDDWMVTNREIVRRVIRGELLEVSPITFPAYPTTSAQVRDHVAALLRAQQGGLEPTAEAELARARRAAERGRHLQLYGGL